MADQLQYLFVAVAGVGAVLAFRYIRSGGWRAVLYGAPVQRTVGEVAGTKRWRMGMTTALKVHVLDGAPDRAVGLEFVVKSGTSYHLTPFALSVIEARNLIALLQAATNGK